MLRSVAGSLAIVALVAVAPSASADEPCTGWFCGEEEGGSPLPTPALPAPGEVGTATIPGPAGNDVLSGVITEIVPGDHLTLKLPSGELKVITWPELLQLQISGKIVIGGGSASPAPSAAPPPAVVVTPAPPAPIAPPPPAPLYEAPSFDQATAPSPAPRREFNERWQLGLRLDFFSPSESSRFSKNGGPMSDYVGSGTAFQADLGYRISPSWTPYGFFEYGSYKRGAANADADDKPSSTAVGLGLQANTNPEGPVGFLFDVGVGYRWITVPFGSSSRPSIDGIAPNGPSGGKVTYGGTEVLRLGLGLSFVTSPSVRWDISFQGAVGAIAKRSDSNGNCAGDRGDCRTIPEENRGAYAFGGLSAALHLDL